MDPLPATIDPEPRSLHNESAASSGIAPQIALVVRIAIGGANMTSSNEAGLRRGRSDPRRRVDLVPAQVHRRRRGRRRPARRRMGLTGWVPAFRVPAAGAATPPSFPADDLAVPTGVQELGRRHRGRRGVDVRAQDPGRCGRGRQLGQGQRVQGSAARHDAQLVAADVHARAPATTTSCSCDTTQYLTSVSIAAGSPATVTAQNRRHDGVAAHAARDRGLRTHGDTRARRPDAGRRARDQRPRHRDPGERRDARHRLVVRIGQQPASRRSPRSCGTAERRSTC